MPLLSAFELADLKAMMDDNFMHVAQVASTADSGRTWSPVANGTNVPCRLMRPFSREPDEARNVAGEVQRITAEWVVAFVAGSAFAAPRLRLTITGTEHGTGFTRVVYTIGALTPLPQTAEARVYAVEDPAAVFGS